MTKFIETNVSQTRKGKFALLLLVVFVFMLLPRLVSAQVSINVEEVVDGEITNLDEIDEYRFNASAGQLIYLNPTLGETTQLRWRLVTPSGIEFTEERFRPTEGAIELPEDGEYSLIFFATPGNLGLVYQFQIRAVPNEPSQSIELDTPIVDEVSVPGEVRRYTFEGVTGESVFFSARRSRDQLNLNWRLIRPDNSIAFTERFTRAQDPQVLTQTGTYTLEVFGTTNAVSPFVQELFRVQDEPPIPIELNERVVTDIDVPGAVVRYTLQAQDGQLLFFDSLRGSRVGEYIWQVLDPQGQRVAGNDFLMDDLFPVEITQSGIHTIVLNASGQFTGVHEFRVVEIEPSPDPQAISFGEHVNGFIDLGQTHEFTFSGVAGQSIQFDILAIEDIFFDMRAPDNSRVFQGLFRDRTVTLNQTGTFTVQVFRSLNGERGNYNFRLFEEGSDPNLPPAADLIVTSLSVPERVIGQPAEFEISYVVSNQGSVSAEGWNVEVAAQLGPSFLGPRYLIGRFSQIFPIDSQQFDVALAPGESREFTQTVRWPEGYDDALIELVVVVDATNDIAEADESNNIFPSGILTSVAQQNRTTGIETTIATDIEDGARFAPGTQLSLSGEVDLFAGAINAIFLIDVSFSTTFEDGFDANGDGSVDLLDDINRSLAGFSTTSQAGDILDVELGAVQALIQDLETRSDDISVTNIGFARGAWFFDSSPNTLSQPFISPNEDSSIVRSTPDYIEALNTAGIFNGLQSGMTQFTQTQFAGGTLFSDAFRRVQEVNELGPDADRTLLFILTDGETEEEVTQADIEALTSEPISLFAFQIGGAEVTESLQDVVDQVQARPGSTAVAQAIENPNNLSDALLSTVNLVGVSVNQRGVQSLDASGRFFTPITIEEGENEFLIDAIDSNGAQATRTITLIGDSLTGVQTNVINLSDSTDARFSFTRYNRRDKKVLSDVSLTNASEVTQVGPFNAEVAPIVPPNVSLDNPSNINAAGVPLLDFSVSGGQNTLPVNTSTESVTAEFDNQQEARFSVSLTPFGSDNSAPLISSTPIVSVVSGSEYRYLVTAIDPDDDDELTFGVTTAPESLQINQQDGQISWLTTTADIGTHLLTIEVSDGRGGLVSQSFQLTVLDATINLPPLFQSAPITRLDSGQDYLYAPQVLDQNGDALVFSLVAPPPGFLIDSASGVVTALALADGDFDLNIQASDNRGGIANQAYRLSVGGNNPTSNVPFISSTPSTSGAVGSLYLYQVLASDADNDVLAFSLIDNPDGMSIDSVSGRILWTPVAAQVGPNTAAVRVDDNNGNFVTQFFTVDVSDGQVNLPPAITSIPSFIATAGELYTYDVAAIDPNGDVLAFSLLTMPIGASIDAQSGLIEFTPDESLVGQFVNFNLAATDEFGASGEQAYSVRVRGENFAPTFTTSPIVTVTSGTLYRYQAIATDADDRVSYNLLQAPPGMQINSQTGLVSLDTNGLPLGNYQVIIQARDERGLAVEQNYTLAVAEDQTPPVVSLISAQGNVVNIGATVNLRVAAIDDVGVQPSSFSLSIGSDDLLLDAQNQATYLVNNAGIFEFLATASDEAGNVGEERLRLRVVDPNDQQGPVIEIEDPSPGTVLDRPSEIRGSVTDDGPLEFYVVEYALIDLVDLEDIAAPNDAWVEIGSGSQTVASGVLAQLDTTILRDGAYIIRVQAQDVSGNLSIESLPIEVDGVELGRLQFEVEDLSIPQAGSFISINRRYNSLESNVVGDFGYGWKLAFSNPDIRETIPLNPNELSSSGFVVNPFFAGTRVYITDPFGQRLGFTFEPVSTATLLGASFRPQFTPDPGVFAQLEVDDVTLNQRSDGSFTLFLFGFDYNPRKYRLVLRDGTVLEYDQFDGIERIVDRANSELIFSPDGIANSDGPVVSITRDSFNRITSVTDSLGGVISYSYDADGNLSSVTDRVGDTTLYRYFDTPAHLVREIEDANNTVQTIEFDSMGRFTGFDNAEGGQFSQVWDSDTFTGTITDAEGGVTMLRYDTRGNILSSEDALGNTTQFAYDQNNRRITQIDPRGSTTRFEYDDLGNQTKVIDALGNETETVFNDFQQPTSSTNALGATISTSYDEQGNIEQITLPGGAASQVEYDDQGRPTSVTDFRGAVLSYEYSGSSPIPVRIDYPTGGSARFQLDQLGRPTSLIDPSGANTLFAYDAEDRLTQITADNDAEHSFVFEAGRASAQIDPVRGEYQWQYNSEDRLTGIVDFSGNTIQMDYDAFGNMISLEDPIGNESRFEFDQIGQLVAEIDPLGARVVHSYDANGNRIRTIDRNGRTREFSYDLLNRLISERWLNADDTLVRTISTTYDSIGRVVRRSDASSSIQYEYDQRNRVIQTDNEGTVGVPRRILNYIYDDNDNLTSVEDDTGVELLSTYDADNRLVSRTINAESTVRVDIDYDLAGFRTSLRQFLDANAEVQFAQTDYTRNSLGRFTNIEQKNGDGDIVVSYTNTYNLINLLVTSEHHGQSFEYTYDDNGQVLGVDRSVFEDESFTYDVNGNRQNGGVAIIGISNRLLEDDLNTYSYDAEGNQVSKTNKVSGAITEYSYDHLNRLIGARQLSSGGSVIGTFSYVYDVEDNRILEQENGRITARVYLQANPWLEQISEPGEPSTSQYFLYSNKIDELIATIDDQGIRRAYWSDDLGTIHDVINSDAEVVNHIDYDSFGVVRNQSDVSEGVAQLFTGREYDAELGLYHFRSRAYDPLAGRFLSEDSIGFDGGDYNLYRFVNNAPINSTDPSGNGALNEYASLLCGVFLPISGAVRTYAECLERLYEGIQMSVAAASNVQDGIVEVFFGCIGEGFLDLFLGNLGGGLGGAFGDSAVNAGAIAINDIIVKPTKLEDPLFYPGVVCNAANP